MKPSRAPERRTPKSFSASVLSDVKQFLSPRLSNVKQFLSSKLSDVKLPLSPKLLVPILVLLLVLVIGLTKCSGNQAPSDELRLGTVSIENLDVHKKPDAGSRVLNQLPMDLEVEILDTKTGEETIWGQIGKMKLPNGKKVKGGWIDLLYVSFGDDSEPDVAETEPETEVEPEPAPIIVSMGTITASKLNIRKGPGSEYNTNGAYFKGDRVEILETRTVDDTVWGRTAQGWIGTGYIRMDGTYTADGSSDVITDGNSNVLGYGIVMLGKLNVRKGPDTIYGKAGTITRGNRYAYYELKDGWARIEDGWVSTEHFYVEGTTTSDAFPAIVTADSLNIRTGPKSSCMLTGTYTLGETVQILAKLGDWGCTEKGWIYLEYVETSYRTGSGTITSGLNVRSDPDANSEIVGTYSIGDQVTVVEVMDNWGRTDLGWINLKYVLFD